MFAWPSADWNLILLIAARILAMIETAPLLSTESIPQVAKVALAGLTAFLVFPSVQASGYAIPADGGEYALLLVGEALIGVIMGFFLTILFSAFAMAGQFFSLQIGFSASETYDPLSEVEIPVMGQFLNLIAMFVFVSNDGFQKLFMAKLLSSAGRLLSASDCPWMAAARRNSSINDSAAESTELTSEKSSSRG